MTTNYVTENKDIKTEINNPFFTYPTYPLRGYSDHVEYKNEIIRLRKYINELKITDGTLLFLCIGAAMEELINDTRYKTISHWRQLFPLCIEHISKFGIPVKIIIISPNESFSSNNFIAPTFIDKTDNDYKWKNIDKSFISTKYNVTVDIFCTLLPHEEKEKNERMVKYLNSQEDIFFHNASKNIYQTDTDIKFIIQFYKELQSCFDNVIKHNGKIACFSYAVFSENSNYSKFNSYNMFTELLDIFPIKSDNMILCRWYFQFESTTMICFNNKKTIDYVHDLILFN